MIVLTVGFTREAATYLERERAALPHGGQGAPNLPG